MTELYIYIIPHTTHPNNTASYNAHASKLYCSFNMNEEKTKEMTAIVCCCKSDAERPDLHKPFL